MCEIDGIVVFQYQYFFRGAIHYNEIYKSISYPLRYEDNINVLSKMTGCLLMCSIPIYFCYMSTYQRKKQMGAESHSSRVRVVELTVVCTSDEDDSQGLAMVYRS